MTSRISRVAVAVLLIACLWMPAVAFAADAPVKALIVTGVDYPGHKWKETTPAVRQILEADGKVDTRIVEDHEFLASDAMFDYDVIVLSMKNYEPTKRADQVRANLEKFVADGGGLVALHFTCGAFERWPEYKQLVGRTWDKKKRGHDPRGPFTVNIADPEHPITSGMKDFEADDELYTCLSDDGPEIHVIATAVSKIDQKVYPMAFVMNVGQGRVFHTLLGHDVKAFTLPGPAELIQRGTIWASGRELQPAE